MDKQEFKYPANRIFGRVLIFLSLAIGYSANASDDFRIVTPEEDHLKVIRSVCDKATGNLLYQSEGKYVSPFDVVPGGCVIESSVIVRGGWRLIAPEWRRFKAIYAFCDLPTGNLIYESESSWVSPIRVVPGGCVDLLHQPSSFLPQPAPAPLPTPNPK